MGGTRSGQKKRQRNTPVDKLKDEENIWNGEDSREQGAGCSACGGQGTVWMDHVHGMLVCEACGAVSGASGRVQHGDDNLVPSVSFDQYGNPEGVFVEMKDSGAGVGAWTMQSVRARHAVQRAQPYDPSIPLKKLIKSLGNSLSVSPTIIHQAEVHATQLSQVLKGSWRRDLIVASSLYIAIRLNRLPLTLLDVTAATGLSVFLIGRYYRAAATMLKLEIPRMDAKILLPKLLETLQLTRDDPSWHWPGDALLHDAELVHDWMMKRDERAPHPLTLAGATIIAAMEMNGIHVGIELAAHAIGTSHSALRKKVHDVKQRLLSYSEYLSFSDNITLANVFSYAAIIIRVTNLPSTGSSPGLLLKQQGQGEHLDSRPHDIVPCRENQTAIEMTDNAQAIDQHTKSPSRDHEVDDFADSEVDEYIRTDDEVALYSQMYDSLIDN